MPGPYIRVSGGREIKPAKGQGYQRMTVNPDTGRVVSMKTPSKRGRGRGRKRGHSTASSTPQASANSIDPAAVFSHGLVQPASQDGHCYAQTSSSSAGPVSSEMLDPHSYSCEMNTNIAGASSYDTPSSKPQFKSYTQKKRERLDKWENLLPELLSVQIEMTGPSQTHCTVCMSDKNSTSGRVNNIIRCSDCGPNAYFCQQHYLACHKILPFHCPEIWQGEVFSPYRPGEKDLPHLKRANHRNCPTSTTELINVVNHNGMFCQVLVDVCECESWPATLLRHHLWPASPENPTTAFHISLMEWYRALVLQCQVSVKGFVDAIAARLNGFRQISRNQVTRLYRALVTDACNNFMFHYDHFQLLGHVAPSLDDGTQCPACFFGCSCQTTSRESVQATSMQQTL